MITKNPEASIRPEAFHGSESGHVYGIVDHPDRDFPAIAAELVGADVPMDGIHIYRSCQASDASGPNGGGQGFLARIHRILEASDGHLSRIRSELDAGHALIGVAVDDARKDEVSATLRRHCGHDVFYYGKYTWQWLGA